MAQAVLSSHKYYGCQKMNTARQRSLYGKTLPNNAHHHAQHETIPDHLLSINYPFNIIMTGLVKQAVTRLDDKTLLTAVFPTYPVYVRNPIQQQVYPDSLRQSNSARASPAPATQASAYTTYDNLVHGGTLTAHRSHTMFEPTKLYRHKTIAYSAYDDSAHFVR